MPTPEEIEAEKAAALKAAADEEARKAALKAAGGKGDPDPDDDDDDDSKLDEKAKKKIEKLRAEAAKHRVDKNQFRKELDDLKSGLKKALGGEGDEPPEKTIESLKLKTEAQTLELLMLKTAMENGISQPDSVEYFQFLIGKELDALSDGEELSAEKIEEIVKKTKKAAGTASAGNGGNTSVNDKNKPNPDGGKGYDGVTVEQFARMSMMDKSVMYEKSPDRYAALIKEAKEKRLIK